MTPLRERIESALRLQPMTVEQLARCLSVNQGTVRRVLADCASVHRVGKLLTKGRPWIRYGLVA